MHGLSQNESNWKAAFTYLKKFKGVPRKRSKPEQSEPMNDEKRPMHAIYEEAKNSLPVEVEVIVQTLPAWRKKLLLLWRMLGLRRNIETSLIFPDKLREIFELQTKVQSNLTKNILFL